MTDGLDFIPIILGVAALATALATAVSVYYSNKHHRERLDAENKSRYITVAQSFSKQLSDLLKEESTLETKEDCELYVHRYLEPLDLIAFLINEGKDKEIANYLSYWFPYGKTMMKWYDEKICDGNTESKSIWEELHKYCENNCIKDEDPKTLPKKMREYDEIKDNKNNTIKDPQFLD